MLRFQRFCWTVAPVRLVPRCTFAVQPAAAIVRPENANPPRQPWENELGEPSEEFLASMPWTPASRRTGVIGRKIGMVTLWDHYGIQFAATVVQVDDCTVLQQQTHQQTKHGLVGLQVGAGYVKPKNVPKPLLVHFNKAGVEPKREIVEFKVTPDALLPVGARITARHFLPGQFLDIRGVTKGKGFQGGMKKHNFGGQNATHGNSVSHRAIGSTGSNSSPGRVWKGKKMPGRMGAENVCMQNMRLYKIDVKRNLLYIHGQVPGNRGGFVQITDAIKKPFKADAATPPFPTYIRKKGEPDADELYIDQSLDANVFRPTSRFMMAS